MKFAIRVLLVLAMFAACTSDDGTARTAAAPIAEPERSGAAVRVRTCEPRTLLPASVTTRCGAQVLTSVFSRLVELDHASGKPSWGNPDDRSVARQITPLGARQW